MNATIINLRDRRKWSGRIVSAAPTKFSAPWRRGEAGRWEKCGTLKPISEPLAVVMNRLRMHRL